MPKNCAECEHVKVLDIKTKQCGKPTGKNSIVGWEFSNELAEEQALCDNRANTTIEVFA